MKIAVTAEDIAQGDPHSDDADAIALAIKRVTGREVFVVYDFVEFPEGETSAIRDILTTRAKLPPEVQEFIDRAEAGLPVQPFSFDLPEAT